MVPRIHARGTSFKGAAAYLLHDKDGAATSGRVAWVETVKLATANPDQAWRVMAATAMDALRLKKEAGVKGTGRKSKGPVLHISLSWEPPDSKPSRKEMSNFAHRALKALKADDRQAMIICHTDTEHPHVHLLINCVSPQDGRMLSSSYEKRALSDLALAYTKEIGSKACPQRAVNAERRKKGEYVRGEKNIPRSLYKALKKAQAEVMSQITPAHRQQNPQAAAMIRARMRKQFRAYLDGIKEQFRPQWRKLYEGQRGETGKAVQEKGTYVDRMLGLFSKPKSGSPAPAAALAFQSNVTGQAAWDAEARQQKQRGERGGIARSQAAEIGKALQEIKVNCQLALRQMFPANTKGGASPAFGPASAGTVPQPTPNQAATQRRVTQLSEKFRREGGSGGSEPPKPPPQRGNRQKDKDRDWEPER